MEQKLSTRAWETISQVLLIFGLLCFMASLGSFLGKELGIALFFVGVGIGFCALCACASTMRRRTLSDAGRSDVFYMSQMRADSGLLYLLPLGAGMLVYQLHVGWFWGIAGVLIGLIIAWAGFFEFAVKFVPGDFLTLHFGTGYFAAQVVDIHGKASRPIYNLRLFPPAAQMRPTHLDWDSLAHTIASGNLIEARVDLKTLVAGNVRLELRADEAPANLRLAD